MAKRKTLFYFIITAIILIAFVSVFHKHFDLSGAGYIPSDVTENKYGAFLAAQHAIYVNDYDSALKMSEAFSDIDYDTVNNTRILAEFLSGHIPTNVSLLADDKNTSSRIIYDAYLTQNTKWNILYGRHKSDKSIVYAPFRIWSGIAKNKKTETLKYIDSLNVNDSWKSFVRGQIFAKYDDSKNAANEFAKVDTDFMNINDYLFIMSFYKAHNMIDKADSLHDKFASTPGGIFMSDYDNIPEWSCFSGIKNSLAFNLVQNVSHTQIMLYSDLSILMLRFAELIDPTDHCPHDAINYYIGQFLTNTHGNYEKYFDKISPDSPFYLFAKMRIAEETKSIDTIKEVIRAQPLFIPALNKLVSHYTSIGNRSDAIRIINRALKNKKLSDSSRAYIIKRRALVNLLFNKLNDAQKDIHLASKLVNTDPEILALQARIWTAQNREIENAYDYAMSMIKRNPSDVVAWDILSSVVLVREGNDAALHILERIGKTANHCSSLFEHLGDALVTAGDTKRAKEAYLRAIDLADDGFSIIPNIERKIRKLK